MPPKSKQASKRKKTTSKRNSNEPKQKRRRKEKKSRKKFHTTINPNARTMDGKKFNKTIVSWNVNGIRAWLKKRGALYFKKFSPDIVCLQETKFSGNKLPAELKKSTVGYYSYFSSGRNRGYAGSAFFSKKKPVSVKFGIGVHKHDQEGRVISADFGKYYVVGVYVPNSGIGLWRLRYRTMEWDVALRHYLAGLHYRKPVILCGDLNVAHQEIDLRNPKANRNKTAGFHDDEREGLTDLLAEGYFDSFRELYPNATGCYTFWSYKRRSRSKNIGWRLDYFVLSNRLRKKLCDHVIQQNVKGSDHCPIVLQMAM